ncbi:hypothetical protein C9374_010865 [Naegleria lovaniensis]|uniref:Uncharacterized protein n=1 Tax=Naegleria lovaniensis TaxID=51637 RepID=A0AA88GAF7_NAELO|nr:uncharacterized protein C9374_010865 [Naegleria lovaniensis]KAG2374295.1 hypothetical protein C9374_010865 [Naegleria lovaniensis]
MKELVSKPFEFTCRHNRHEKRYNPYGSSSTQCFHSLKHRRVVSRMLLSTSQRRLLMMRSEEEEELLLYNSSATSSGTTPHNNPHLTTSLNNNHLSSHATSSSPPPPHISNIPSPNYTLHAKLKALVDQFFETLLKTMETIQGRKALIMSADDRQRLQQELMLSTDFVSRVLNGNSNHHPNAGGNWLDSHSIQASELESFGLPQNTLFQFERFWLSSGKEVFVMVSNVIPGHRSIYLASFSIINR